MTEENTVAGTDAPKARRKATRRPQTPRPVHLLWKAGEDGEPEIVDITRDANKVVDLMDNDPDLRRKKLSDFKLGR